VVDLPGSGAGHETRMSAARALASHWGRLYTRGACAAGLGPPTEHRARTSLDRHATYIVAAYVAGAAR
jgi:hypothetical protein